MKIAIDIASSAAANPNHPEHGKWVKQQMLEREVNWLRSIGVEVHGRKVDKRIDQGLQRLAARKRENRPKPVKRDKLTLRSAERLAEKQGARLIRRPLRAPVKPPPYACKRCGTCLRCRREARAVRLLELAKAGDTKLLGLAQELIRTAMRAQARLGMFDGLSSHDANRVVTRIVEDVCDRSVPVMGPWRR